MLKLEPVVVGSAEDRLLEKLIGRQVVGLAFVPETCAAMICLDADTTVYFRVVNYKLQMEVEGPAWQ